MERPNSAYIKLQKHLDNQAVGFPATRTGTELKVLLHIFTPEEAAIDMNRCIGCGVCVPGCPGQSISLEKKPTEVKPPQSREELHDIIAATRTGRIGKLKLIGKLVVDSVRTGHFDLLK